jgi:predicted MFS family arabinose efflux permease
VTRRGLLAARQVRLVLAALVFSGWADGFLPVTLSFAVLHVTGSVARLGLVLAAQGGVALLLTLAGGLAGDRFPRRPIMIVSLAARAVVAAVIAATLLAGVASFPLLLTMAGVYGCADGFFGPASAALLPEIVPREHLAPANALIGGTSSAANAAAPAIAGAIVATLGTGAAFAIQATTLAIALGGLAVVRIPASPLTRTSRARVARQLWQGWAEFAKHRWLWLLTVEWAVFSLVILAPVNVLGPAIAQRSLGGAFAWGIIGSCLSLGAVAGQVMAGRARMPVRPALIMACLLPFMAAEALALGLGLILPVVALMTAVSGFALGVQAVIFPTAMQTSIPPDMLARVTSIDLLTSEGGQPAGYVLAGPVGAAIGPHAYLTFAGIGIIAASATYALLPSLRVRAVSGSL